jgi:hypothetical protein
LGIVNQVVVNMKVVDQMGDPTEAEALLTVSHVMVRMW